MDAQTHIHKIEIESLDPAFSLLQRLFAEEGFNTPAELMRTSLITMLKGNNSALLIALRVDQALGIATVTTLVGLEYGLSAELEDLYVQP